MHGGTRTLLQTMAGCDVAPENGFKRFEIISRFLFESLGSLCQFLARAKIPHQVS